MTGYSFAHVIHAGAPSASLKDIPAIPMFAFAAVVQGTRRAQRQMLMVICLSTNSVCLLFMVFVNGQDVKYISILHLL